MNKFATKGDYPISTKRVCNVGIPNPTTPPCNAALFNPKKKTRARLPWKMRAENATKNNVESKVGWLPTNTLT
jgi:hypothetical protein